MKKTILLVEDNPDHADIITDIMLEDRNYNFEKEIILKKDGEEAIDYLQGAYLKSDNGVPSQVELIMLDLGLPKIEGMDVLKFLKENPRYRSTPVIIISANSDQKTIAEAYDRGADSFVVKPISYDEFVRKLIAMEESWMANYF